MPEKKRQHYLPQFYQRYFSTDGEKKLISLYNLKSQELIQDVPIKSQGCKDYLYGQDDMEYAMELIERAGSGVLPKMISNNTHPKYKSSDHHAILSFTLILYARTPSAGKEINETINRSLKTIFCDDPELKDIRIEFENPVLAALGHVAMLEPLMYDLGFKVLVNQTSIPFITSDHPVVLYNQFFETRSVLRGGNTGLSAKGLQIFLPISPKHQIIFYDQKMYKVGGRKHSPIYVRNSKDVDYLNGLQYLNSQYVLYFNNDISEKYLDSLLPSFSKYRRTNKSYTVKLEGGEKNNGDLILTSKEDIQCHLSLTFIKLTKKAKEFKVGNRLAYPRNELLTKLHDLFRTLVSQGKYDPNDFDKFLSDVDKARESKL